jgi:hypothetical protein
MSVIGGVRIDEGLADILKKLKETESKEKEKEKDQAAVDNADDDNTKEETPVNSSNSKVPSVVQLDAKEVKSVANTDNDTLDNDVLPWFTKNDKDTDLIHYLKLDDNGKIVSATIRSDKSIGDLAALKLKSNYLCDVDYYKSKHYVLFVRQLNSDYEYSRSFIATNESAKENIIVEDTTFVDDNPELTKVPTENVTTLVADSTSYTHYIVFTDLGIADFISNDDMIYSINNQDLSKWFEIVSNSSLIKNANFDKNKLLLSDKAELIRDFKYNLITIRRPGIFTLDSMDNDDPDYHLNIKLKDEFSFIPGDSILKCLKSYSNGNKSIGEFRRFIDRYFDII